MTEAPERYVGRRRTSQGGPGPRNRAGQLDRQHQAAGHAAHGRAAQPLRPREDNQPRRLGGALEQPGVVAAFTGDDLADEWPGGVPCAWRGHRGHQDARLTGPSPRTKCNYMGDAVAVVVAERPLHGPGRPRVHRGGLRAPRRGRGHGGRLSRRTPRWSTRTSAPTSASSWPLGGWATSMTRSSEADVVVKERYIQQRLIPNAIEPRAVVAQPEPGPAAGTSVLGDPGPPPRQDRCSRWRPGFRRTRSGWWRRTWAAASAPS